MSWHLHACRHAYACLLCLGLAGRMRSHLAAWHDMQTPSSAWDWMQAATITDQDIDAILARGVRETEELNNKMKEYTENAMKFTMDGGFNAYEFKDEEDAGDNVDYKQLIGATWDPLQDGRCCLRDVFLNGIITAGLCSSQSSCILPAIQGCIPSSSLPAAAS